MTYAFAPGFINPELVNYQPIHFNYTKRQALLMPKSKTTNQKTSSSPPPQPESCSWARPPQAARAGNAPRHSRSCLGYTFTLPPLEKGSTRGETRKGQLSPQSVRGRWHLETLRAPQSETGSEPSQPLPHLRDKDNSPLPT